jgi:hypothetical protein
MVRLRASHSYGFVLLLIFVSFVFTAAGPDNATWGQGVLVLIQTATLVVALWTSGLGRAAALLSVLLVAVGITVAAAQILSGGDTLTGATAILNALLLVTVGVVIAVGVFDQRTVNRQSVLGAICIYLLIGMDFTFVYGAAAALGSGDFFADGTDGTPSLRLYLSYVTLTTVGYGDAGRRSRTHAGDRRVAPRSPLPRDRGRRDRGPAAPRTAGAILKRDSFLARSRVARSTAGRRDPGRRFPDRVSC